MDNDIAPAAYATSDIKGTDRRSNIVSLDMRDSGSLNWFEYMANKTRTGHQRFNS
jgi:hypothetical protein